MPPVKRVVKKNPSIRPGAGKRSLRASSISQRLDISNFHPRSIFLDSTKGAIYDYDDFAYLYQKSYGSVPVTALEQPVGLMLDKRYGGLAGLSAAELLSTGTVGLLGTATAATFNTSTGAGTATRVDVSNQSYVKFTVTAGRWYRVQLTNTGANALAIRDLNGTTISAVWATVSAGASFNGFVLATNGLCICSSSATASFTVTSIRELPGLHAYQSTDAARPVLSARYNLLTYTEDVTPRAGVWAHSNVAAYSNQAEGVCRVQTAGSGTKSFISAQASGVAVNQTLRARIQIRSVGYSGTLNVDLQEAISPFTSTTQTITPTAEWQTVEVTRTLVTAGVSSAYIRLLKGSATVGGTFEFRFPDLRLTADANSRLPAYQRVTTATDYDSNGFPRFLRIDATDDFMQTASVDSGTDKVFVCAGVTKTNYAGASIVVESSANTNTNAGAFYLAAPGSAAANVVFATKGSAASPAATTFSGLSAPFTGVLTGVGDIAGDISRVRANATANIGDNTNDQGTGNYTAQPIYIGARAGTSIRLNNGRIYPMVIVFKLPTAGEIAATETWSNRKTKAY